jgi:RHS repeat-associated protein
MYDGSVQCVPLAHKFTGKERDSESGLDNFEARYLGSSMGRFMSADPENLSGLINQDDPQAWNGYAYVRNNPLVYTDPGGTNYTVCDTNGKNCADLTDKQFNQYLKDNPDVSKTASGDLYVGNTKVGSAGCPRFGLGTWVLGPLFLLLVPVSNLVPHKY